MWGKEAVHAGAVRSRASIRSHGAPMGLSVTRDVHGALEQIGPQRGLDRAWPLFSRSSGRSETAAPLDRSSPVGRADSLLGVAIEPVEREDPMNDLAKKQAEMVAIWEAHLAAEFGAKSAEASLATMTEEPSVLLVPVAIGGAGHEGVMTLYAKHFLPQIPADIEMIPVARTVGEDRIVDEMVLRFTHSVGMDCFLPGIPPTGKRIEMAMVAVVEIRDGKVAGERLYWDQATLLVQIGLLDRSLPVVGAEGARRVLDATAPMNDLLNRAR